VWKQLRLADMPRTYRNKYNLVITEARLYVTMPRATSRIVHLLYMSMLYQVK